MSKISLIMLLLCLSGCNAEISNITWGFFGINHILSLILASGIIYTLYKFLENKQEKLQILTLGILSFSGIFAIIYNLIIWESPIEYLPFHLCSLNAMVLPIAVFTKNKHLNNLLLLWSLGAILAIVVNSAQANYEVFSLTFAIYYFPHVLEFGIPILMFKLNLVEKDISCIKNTLIITLISYTIIHLINVTLNNYLELNNILDYAGNLIQVNYMYSIKPENPVMSLFYQILPYEYWYMYLAIPIILIYLLLIYLKEFKQFIKFRFNN